MSSLHETPQAADRAVFDLLRNPFAIIGAVPTTPNAALADGADAVGTAEAAAALRALAVPRTRLAAEVAFLPGAALQAPALLAALRARGRPDLAALPAAARANVLAHLCASGLATPDDQAALAAAQPAPGDAALAAAIDQDRAQAGVPPLQPQALLTEQDALADRHAAALAGACAAGPDPAARLAVLVRDAPDGAAPFLRKVAASWARQSATALADADAAAGRAKADLLAKPDGAATGRLIGAVQAWAALSLPQLLSDARAGLDHPPTLRALRPWRDAAARLAEEGHPDLACQLAAALAAAFTALPGEASRLRAEAHGFAGLLEERQLESRLAPLRDLAERLGAAPAALEAALARAPFGAGSRGVAAELWAAFDAACAACTTSEAPWTIVRALANRIGGPARPSGAIVAHTLLGGLVARAETAGFGALAARLRTEQAALQREVALWLYLDLNDRTKKNGDPWRLRRVRTALRQALLLAVDPDERRALLGEEGKLTRRIRTGWSLIAAIPVVVAALAAVAMLDNAYSRNAPYRHAAPAALVAEAATRPGLASPAPAPAPLPVMPSTDEAPPAPLPLAPASPALVPPVDGAPAYRPAFLAHTALAERQPHGNRVRTLAEVRWCMFNQLRLDGAMDSTASPAQVSGVLALQRVWSAVCDSYDAHRGDIERASSERDRYADRLATEGHAMLHPPAP